MSNPFFGEPYTRGLSKGKEFDQARWGRVNRVDYENMLVDLTWDQYSGGVPEVPITFAYSGPRSVLGGMPEEGASVLTDFFTSGAHQAQAVISSYLPVGYKAGINQRLVRETRNDFPLWEIPKIRRKFRKIYPGEIIGSSTYGSDLLLDENTTLLGMKGDEIRIDSRDQSINQISLQNFVVTDGSRHSKGWIYRFQEESYDESGKPVAQYNTLDSEQQIVDSSGKRRWYRTLSGAKSVDDYYIESTIDAAPLTEVRTEIREIGYGYLPLTDQNVDVDEWGNLALVGNSGEAKNDKANNKNRIGNIIETVQGTLVGYNPGRNYGKVLRPQVFPSDDTSGYDVTEIPVSSVGPDYTEVRMLSAAAMFKMPYPYAQTRMYASKEGHIHLHVGSTWQQQDCPFEPKIEHPLGGGRSVEANFAGSIKAVVDKNVKREESLDLKTIGKVYFHLGKDDAVPSHIRRNLLVDGQVSKPGQGYGLAGVTTPYLSEAPGTPDIRFARNWSVEGVTDGGITLRVGRTHGRNIREYEQNGFTADGIDKIDGIPDVRDVGRAKYPKGDKFYRYHDLRTVGQGAPGRIGSAEGDERDASAVTDPDLMGTSLDAHLVGNAFLRVGKNGDGNSLVLDTAGALIAALGAENKDRRSIVASLDGGIELNIGKMADSGNSIQAILAGGINFKVAGDNVGQKAVMNFDGNQEIAYNGNHSVRVRGILAHNITGDVRETYGSSHSTTITRDQTLSINGRRVTAIGNIPPGDVADKLTITTGNKESRIATKGDILEETKLGNILIQTLKGNLEFKTLIGDIVADAIAGQIKLQSFDIQCGPASAPKQNVLNTLTPCLLMGKPHDILPALTTKAT